MSTKSDERSVKQSAETKYAHQHIGIASTSAQPPHRAGRVASLLRGDLDWITMKALEKDRARRYGSVSNLAADVGRHLTHQPVLAGAPSTVYRARKFVQRHSFGVAAVAIALLLVIGFGAAMALQARRVARERDRANAEARRANVEAAAARQVSDFLVGLFKVSDPDEARGKAPHSPRDSGQGGSRR